MTGPQQRILSGYHAIAQKVVNESDLKKDRVLTNFSMPELEHNINCLIEVSAEVWLAFHFLLTTKLE